MLEWDPFDHIRGTDQLCNIQKTILLLQVHVRIYFYIVLFYPFSIPFTFPLPVEWPALSNEFFKEIRQNDYIYVFRFPDVTNGQHPSTSDYIGTKRQIEISNPSK